MDQKAPGSALMDCVTESSAGCPQVVLLALWSEQAHGLGDNVNSCGKAKTVVVTRTKDRSLLLARAINSVLSQADSDFLHVIVNDGGNKQDVDALVESHQSRYGSRLLLIHNEQSLGMEAASNVAIRSSESAFMVIHDDDDTWDPQFLARMTKALETEREVKNFGGVICYTTEVRERISGDAVSEVSRHSIASLGERPNLWRMCAGNVFPPIAFLYKREVFDKIGLYREDLPVQGDWEFNLRFMQHFEVGLVEEYLAFYHIRLDSNKAQGVYSNSVSKAKRHQFFNNYLRNEFLRQDLADGKLGVGYMMNINPILLRLDRMSLRLLNLWEAFKLQRFREKIKEVRWW